MTALPGAGVAGVHIPGKMWAAGEIWHLAAVIALVLTALVLYRWWQRRSKTKLTVAIKKGKFVEHDAKGLKIDDNISCLTSNFSRVEVCGEAEAALGVGPFPGVYYLETQKGRSERARYLLFSGENLVGRDAQAVVCLRDPLVSWRHARIMVEKSGLTIEDLLSINGTYVNSERIRKQALQPGDEIKIGRIVFKITNKKP